MNEQDFLNILKSLTPDELVDYYHSAQNELYPKYSGHKMSKDEYNFFKSTMQSSPNSPETKAIKDYEELLNWNKGNKKARIANIKNLINKYKSDPRFRSLLPKSAVDRYKQNRQNPKIVEKKEDKKVQGATSSSTPATPATPSGATTSTPATNRGNGQRYYTSGYEDRVRELGLNNRNDIIDWQNTLKAGGYDIGSHGVDGVWGKDTERAYQEYLRMSNPKPNKVTVTTPAPTAPDFGYRSTFDYNSGTNKGIRDLGFNNYQGLLSYVKANPNDAFARDLIQRFGDTDKWTQANIETQLGVRGRYRRGRGGDFSDIFRSMAEWAGQQNAAYDQKVLEYQNRKNAKHYTLDNNGQFVLNSGYSPYGYDINGNYNPRRNNPSVQNYEQYRPTNLGSDFRSYYQNRPNKTGSFTAGLVDSANNIVQNYKSWTENQINNLKDPKVYKKGGTFVSKSPINRFKVKKAQQGLKVLYQKAAQLGYSQDEVNKALQYAQQRGLYRPGMENDPQFLNYVGNFINQLGGINSGTRKLADKVSGRQAVINQQSSVIPTSKEDITALQQQLWDSGAFNGVTDRRGNQLTYKQAVDGKMGKWTQKAMQNSKQNNGLLQKVQNAMTVNPYATANLNQFYNTLRNAGFTNEQIQTAWNKAQQDGTYTSGMENDPHAMEKLMTEMRRQGYNMSADQLNNYLYPSKRSVFDILNYAYTPGTTSPIAQEVLQKFPQDYAAFFINNLYPYGYIDNQDEPTMMNAIKKATRAMFKKSDERKALDEFMDLDLKNPQEREKAQQIRNKWFTNLESNNLEEIQMRFKHRLDANQLWAGKPQKYNSWIVNPDFENPKAKKLGVPTYTYADPVLRKRMQQQAEAYYNADSKRKGKSFTVWGDVSNTFNNYNLNDNKNGRYYQDIWDFVNIDGPGGKIIISDTIPDTGYKGSTIIRGKADSFSDN